MAKRPDQVADSLVIRRIRPEDGAALLEIADSVADWFSDESLEEMADDLEDDPGLVALLAGKPVGWLTWYQSEDGDPGLRELTWIAVDARHRGRGIGRALVEALCDALVAEGARAVDVWTVGEESGFAHWAETTAFYRALGFSFLRRDAARPTAGGNARTYLRRPLAVSTA